jgi:hypothetical protein
VVARIDRDAIDAAGLADTILEPASCARLGLRAPLAQLRGRRAEKK